MLSRWWSAMLLLDRRIPRLPRLWCLAVFLLVGCLPKSAAPRPDPAADTPRVLGPAPQQSEGGPSQGLRVIHTSPEGAVGGTQLVTIIFDRPLRALAKLGMPCPPIAIEPAADGEWEWVGTHAVTFVPKGLRFPDGTGFKVTIPQGLAALDGTRLDRARTFSFETRRPIARISPTAGRPRWQEEEASRLGAREAVQIDFDVPVAASELERALHVQSGQHPLAYLLESVSGTQNRGFLVRPASTWPLGHRVLITIDPSLRGMEGPLTAGRAISLSQLVHAAPSFALRCELEGARCGTDSVSLVSENPVLAAELVGGVRVEPHARLRVTGSRIDFSGLARHSHYAVDLPGGLPGIFGGVTKPQHFEFDTRERPPRVKIELESGPIEPGLLRPFEVRVEGSPSLGWAALPLEPLQVLQSLEPYREFSLLDELYRYQSVALDGAGEYRESRDIRDALGAGRTHGAVLLGAATSPENVDERLVQVTDLGVSCKLSAWGGLLWVHRLSTTEPVAGAEVSLMAEGRLEPLGRTDSKGLLEVPPDAARVWGDQVTGIHARAPRIRMGGMGPLSSPAAARNGAASPRPTEPTDWYPRVAPRIPPTGEGHDMGFYVRSGPDWTVLRINHVPGLSPPWVLDGFIEPEPLRALLTLFTDRDPYRPGDTVHIKGVLRGETPGTHVPLPRRPVQISLTGPEGPLVAQVATTDEFGGFSGAFTLPSAGPRGVWLAMAQSEGETARAEFYVSDIRPTEFVAKVVGPEDVIVGRPARFAVSGEYLFGRAMAGAVATCTSDTQPGVFKPPGTEGEVTGLEGWHRVSDEASPDPIRPSEIRLDAQGRGACELSAGGSFSRPQVLTVEATVFDASHEAISQRSTAVLHPADYYLALRVRGAAVAGSPLRFSLRGVTPQGRTVRPRDVEVSLEHVVPYWETEERRAKMAKDASCVVRSGQNSCLLVPPRSGEFALSARGVDERGRRIEVGRDLSVVQAPARRFLRAQKPHWSRRGVEAVSLELDRSTYHVGDTARLEIRSPYPKARALVTLERSKIYWQKSLTVGQAATLEIPVLGTIGRNAWVEVLLLQEPGRSQATCPRNQGFTPTAAQGRIELEVDPDDWRLKVELRPKATLARPNDRVPIELFVTDRLGHGRRAEVTLWAVDEGVLALRATQTPDLLPFFTRTRPDETQTLEARAGLGWILTPPVGDDVFTGGDGSGTAGGDSIPSLLGPSGRAARTRGDPTPLFLPHLVTDDQGRATAELALPGQATAFRVMAVAHTVEGEFGSNQATIRVRLPLLARAALPRFLRVGDELGAGVLVSGDTNQPEVVAVKAEGQGLEPVGTLVREVRIQGQDVAMAPFAWRAARAGTASVRFDIASESASDAILERFPVTYPKSTETVALYGETRGVARERLGDLSGLDPERTKLEVMLASTALAGLGGSLQALLDYRYDCSEQLMGRLLALGGFAEIRRQSPEALPPYDDQVYQSLLTQLLGRQQGGGFAFWDDPREPRSVWLTAYVAWGLNELVRSGRPVPESSLNGARQFLSAELDKDSMDEGEKRRRLEPEVLAFMLDVMASLPGKHQRLSATLGKLLAVKDLPLFAQAHVLRAAIASKKSLVGSEPRLARLVEAVESSVKLSGDRAVAEADNRYPARSSAADRTTALVLRALLAYDRSHPLLPSLARGLLAMQRGAGWSSTQATVQALAALDEYRRVVEDQGSDFLARAWLGSRRIGEARFLPNTRQAALLTLPGSDLRADSDLVFEKRGQGVLRYVARLTYARQQLVDTPEHSGFRLEHWVGPLVDASTRPRMEPFVGTNEIELGTSVVGHVFVTAPVRREQVVVEVPLAAGFEPIDPRLTTSPQVLVRYVEGLQNADPRDRSRQMTAREWANIETNLGAVLAEGVSPGAPRLQTWLDERLGVEPLQARQEIRDDSIVFFVDQMPPGMHAFSYLARARSSGRFLVPAARVEEMYAPEHFATTADAVLVVKRQRAVP